MRRSRNSAAESPPRRKRRRAESESIRPMKGLGVAALALAAVAATVPVPHWQTQSSGVTARLRGVSAATDRVAWASGAGGTVVRPADGGATCHTRAVPGAETLDFPDVD